MIAKKLTDNSFIMINGLGELVSFVFKRDNKFLSTHNLEFFDSLESISADFNDGNVNIVELPPDDISENKIHEYPIKHTEFHDVESKIINGADSYTYKTRPDTDIITVAGWWVIAKETSNRMTLSPKLSSVTDTSVGPFKTKFSCQAEMRRMNRDLISK